MRRRDDARLFGLPRDNFDWPLFLVASALAVLGVINLYSATSVARAALSDVYVQQVYWLVLGGILGAIVAIIDYRHYERLGYLLYALGVVLLLLVFILGKDIRGSSRWIYIGSFSFQPSEFMKLFLVIALAKYLHDDPKNEERGLVDLIVPALLAGVPVLLVLKQPDLGTALILLLTFGTVCMMMRIRWQSLLALAVATGILLPVLWTYVLKEYQKDRLLIYRNPEHDPMGMGYSLVQSKTAIGSGGIFGKGLFAGHMTQHGFVPENWTDFIFTVLGEEQGLIGCLGFLALFAMLLVCTIRAAHLAHDLFGALLCAGVATLLSFQLVVNVAMTIGLAPVVGLPLPLASYGGSALLTNLCAVGVVASVTATSRRRKSAEE